MGVRRIGALIRNLPTGSSTVLALRGHVWSDQDQYQGELAALNVEFLHLLHRTMLGLWGHPKKTKIPDPVILPRPWRPTPKPELATPEVRREKNRNAIRRLAGFAHPQRG